MRGDSILRLQSKRFSRGAEVLFLLSPFFLRMLKDKKQVLKLR